MAIIIKQKNWSFQKQVVIAGDDVEDDVKQVSVQKNVAVLNF
jgi:hypothetical protein